MEIPSLSSADILPSALSERPRVELAAAESTPAPASLSPNPRIEFDSKLGIAVLEFQDGATNAVTYYPAAARKDFSASDWDVRA